MKYLRLIIKNVGRNKRRTTLTILSVMVSVFLLATMQAVIAALGGVGQLTGGEYRVIVRRNTSIADSMPEAYRQKIEQVPGVTAAFARRTGLAESTKKTSRGIRSRSSSSTRKTLFDVQFELQLSPEEKAAFQQERTAAIAGKKLADKYGWKLGDVIELKGAIYPLDAETDACAASTPGLRKRISTFIASMSRRLSEDPGRVGPVPRENRFAVERRASDGRHRQPVQELGGAHQDRNRSGVRGGFYFDARKREGLDKRYRIGRSVHDHSDRREHDGDVRARAIHRSRGDESARVQTGDDFDVDAFRSSVDRSVWRRAGGDRGEGDLISSSGLGDMLALFLAGLQDQRGHDRDRAGASALIGLVSGGIPAWNAARINIVDGLRRVA